MTDKDIIEYLRTNKYQKAVNGLYNALSPIKKYVCNNSGNGEDAKDIFQDALVILYKKVQANDLNLTVPLATYLQAIAKNLWLQELRRRNKLPQTAETFDTLLAAGTVADVVAEDEKSTGLAMAAFNLLGDKCRQLLILFYFKKKSFREIAAALAFSDEKTAKNQKYRCIQKAKENYLTLSNSSHAE